MRDRVRGVCAVGALVGCLVIGGGCGGGGSSTRESGMTSGRTASRYEGGERSIEEFGSEARGADRAALLDVFHTYLRGIAKRDYWVACSYLAASVQHSLQQFSSTRGEGSACAEILPHLLGPAAATIARQQTRGKVIKIRIEQGRAFFVFHAPGARLYQLPFVKEGRDWKVSLLAASVLAPSLSALRP